MTRRCVLAGLIILLGSSLALAAGSPLGVWKTVDAKSGKVRSTVEIYEEGGKVFGRIASLTEPNDGQGRPKVCIACPGADKGKPVVGLVIIRDLSASGDRYKGGTIMDPEDGKVYKAEIWVEGDTLKVRGYSGAFYKTQSWLKGG